MGISEKKRTFLEDGLLPHALTASLGSQFDKARRVFKKAKDEKEEKEFEQKRAKFRVTFTSELRNLARGYSRKVESEPHIQTIGELAKHMKERHEDILNGGKLFFGVAQKALNLYLKYLWCANLDICPPHCPFDNKIISELKLTSAFEHRWTYAEKADDYREWVRLATLAAAKEGFTGDLALSEWEVKKWAEKMGIV
jgi:hypothetical protein